MNARANSRRGLRQVNKEPLNLVLAGSGNSELAAKKMSGSCFFHEPLTGVQELVPRDLSVFAGVGLFGFLFARMCCLGLRRWRGLLVLLWGGLMLLWRRLVLLRSSLMLLRGCRFRRAFVVCRSRLTF